LSGDQSITEGRLIGAILQDNSVFDAAGQLRPEDFEDARHRYIFQVVVELHTAGKPADLITVSQVILDRGDSDRVGGLAYLSSLTDGVLPQRAGVYAQSLRDSAARKRVQLFAELVVLKAQDGHVSNDELLRTLEGIDHCRTSLSACSASSIRKFSDVPDVFRLGSGEIEWLVQDLLPKQSVIVIASDPGTGKTSLALDLCACLVLSQRFLGRRVYGTPCLFIDRENPLPLIQSRLRNRLGETTPGFAVWGMWNDEQPPMPHDPRYLSIAKETQPVMIFDTLSCFHDGNESDAVDMAPLMARFRALAAAGATVVLLHHKPKAEGTYYRGSSVIPAASDVALRLTQDGEGTLLLESFKNRFGAPFKISILPDFERGLFTAVDSPAYTKAMEEQTELLDLITAKPGLSQSEVVQLHGGKRSRIIDLLESGTGRYWKYELGKRSAKLYYALPVPLSGNSSQQNGTDDTTCSPVPSSLRGNREPVSSGLKGVQ
jgi:AAA domain/DnaB-like helicase N terminal domain